MNDGLSSKLKPQIDGICDVAINNFPDFWDKNKTALTNAVNGILEELDELKKASKKNLAQQNFSDLLAVWVISGSGCFNKPIIDTTSDQKFKSCFWYPGTDRARLLAGEKIIKYAREQGSDPFLVYNGTSLQNKTLVEHAGKDFSVQREKIFIPEGEIIRTSDQVKNFNLPSELKNKKGSIGLVSHVAHIPRILRFLEKERPLCIENKEIVAFPVSLGTEGDLEMAKLEIRGILDYIAKEEASIEPYKFEVYQ